VRHLKEPGLTDFAGSAAQVGLSSPAIIVRVRRLFDRSLRADPERAGVSGRPGSPPIEPSDTAQAFRDVGVELDA